MGKLGWFISTTSPPREGEPAGVANAFLSYVSCRNVFSPKLPKFIATKIKQNYRRGLIVWLQRCSGFLVAQVVYIRASVRFTITFFSLELVSSNSSTLETKAQFSSSQACMMFSHSQPVPVADELGASRLFQDHLQQAVISAGASGTECPSPVVAYRRLRNYCPSDGNPVNWYSLFLAWSRPEYSFACFTLCQEFYYCNFYLPFTINPNFPPVLCKCNELCQKVCCAFQYRLRQTKPVKSQVPFKVTVVLGWPNSVDMTLKSNN